MYIIQFVAPDYFILLEIVVHPASDSVSLKTQIHILGVSSNNVILVEDIIQALIEVFQVEEDHSASSLHAYLDLVDISTHLYTEHLATLLVGTFLPNNLCILFVLWETASKENEWLNITYGLFLILNTQIIVRVLEYFQSSIVLSQKEYITIFSA